MDITIVGAGVIGLTTALALEERGHTVRIVAAADHASTTSAIAGAVWFPYRAGPPAKVARWAAETRAWLEQLATEGVAGIDVLTGYEITAGRDEAIPWWAANIEVTRAPAPITGKPLAWQFVAPRVVPAQFLPWLASQLHATVERRAVSTLAAEPGDVVINCTGLAARRLAGDDSVVPLLGQIVITEIGNVDRTISVTDNRAADIFYMIPRRDELVLGGCSLPWSPDAPPEIDAAVTARILDQARALGLEVGGVRRILAGLRPFRPEVRLERDPRDPRILHNYGHGGAGFTLCRGCADAICALIDG